jgi:ketosteroid isomerase-like protein
MKSNPVGSAVIGSLLLACAALAAGPEAVTADRATLTALGCEMGHAYAHQDLAALDKLNADDYTQTDTRGVVVTHGDYLEYVRQRTADTFRNGVSTLSIDCDNIEVRLYGDAAVVTGEWTYRLRKPEGDTSRRSRWTSMWTRYSGGWKRHAFQNTWLNLDANKPVPVAAAMLAGIGPDTTSSHEAETPERQVPPELNRAIAALSGSWSISEEYPPSALYPQGGVGHGTEVWRAGPGNIDLAYEYHSTNPSGEIWATAVLWWDSKARKLRELWCTSRSPSGCVLSNAEIRWDGGDLVFSDAYEVKGQRFYSREVWSQMEYGAHTMTIFESTTHGDFRPWIVSHALRIK